MFWFLFFFLIKKNKKLLFCSSEGRLAVLCSSDHLTWSRSPQRRLVLALCPCHFVISERTRVAPWLWDMALPLCSLCSHVSLVSEPCCLILAEIIIGSMWPGKIKITVKKGPRSFRFSWPLQLSCFSELQLLWEFQNIVCCRAGLTAYTVCSGVCGVKWRQLWREGTLSAAVSQVHMQCHPVEYGVAASSTLAECTLVTQQAPCLGLGHHQVILAPPRKDTCTDEVGGAPVEEPNQALPPSQ